MTTALMDPVLDRMLRHMAWSNAHVLRILSELPADAYSLAAPESDWSIDAILEHFVRSAGFYAYRLGAQIPEFTLERPRLPSELLAYKEMCAVYDNLLRSEAGVTKGETTFYRDGRTITRARSTILAQSIYHATEHRTQIAGILVLHGIKSIDLDEIDLWALGDAEGLGE